MPVVTFHHEHRSFEVEPGTNLRRLMLKVNVSPYRGLDQLLNCRGHNFCGTCAVEIVDGKGVSIRGQDEEATLAGNLAIAKVVEKNVRLACQTHVTGNLTVKTNPVRAIDKGQTRQRFTLIGIASFFGLVLGAMFVFLLLDMIKMF
jgi:ferredoxin